MLWSAGVVVRVLICDTVVTGSTPCREFSGNNLGQVVHTHVCQAV